MIEEIKTQAHKQAHEFKDKKVAAKLAQGLTLVPYYVRSRTGSARAEREPQNEYATDREGPSDSQIKRGVRTAYCAWIKLKHGESIAQAAARLSRDLC